MYIQNIGFNDTVKTDPALQRKQSIRFIKNNSHDLNYIHFFLYVFLLVF